MNQKIYDLMLRKKIDEISNNLNKELEEAGIRKRFKRSEVVALLSRKMNNVNVLDVRKKRIIDFEDTL